MRKCLLGLGLILGTGVAFSFQNGQGKFFKHPQFPDTFSFRELGTTLTLSFGWDIFQGYYEEDFGIVEAQTKLRIIACLVDTGDKIVLWRVSYSNLRDTTIITNKLCISSCFGQVGVTLGQLIGIYPICLGDTITIPDTVDGCYVSLAGYSPGDVPSPWVKLKVLGPVGLEEDDSYTESKIRFGPNPFFSRIEFETDKTVEIYNISGRLVRHLAKEKFWDGKDENGVEVPAGVYFCRFGPESEIKEIKIVKLK